MPTLAGGSGDVYLVVSKSASFTDANFVKMTAVGNDFGAHMTLKMEIISLLHLLQVLLHL